jgi:hypothetical protein
MVQQTREMRGLPLWLLKIYLCEVGGHEVGDDRVEGPGWSAQVAQMEDFQVGAVRVGQVRLCLEVEDSIFEGFIAALEKKLLRAGG